MRNGTRPPRGFRDEQDEYATAVQVNLKKVVLEKVRFAAQGSVSDYVIHDVEFQSWSDRFAESLVGQLRGAMFGREAWSQVTETTEKPLIVGTEKRPIATERYPRDWWNAVKDRFIPLRWTSLRKRIQYRTVTTYLHTQHLGPTVHRREEKHYRMCPHIPLISLPDGTDTLVLNWVAGGKLPDEIERYGLRKVSTDDLNLELLRRQHMHFLGTIPHG